MTDALGDKWPSYAIGSDKHVHALGVVAINYNRLEIALDRILNMYLDLTRETYCFIFDALNENSLQALFKLCVNKDEGDPALREHLIYFIGCYEVCAQNRNTLMHANVDDEKSTDEFIALAKASRNKPHITNEMKFSVAQLRAAADEMSELFCYAAELYRFMLVRERRESRAVFADPQAPLPPALPGKPAARTSLAPKPPPTR